MRNGSKLVALMACIAICAPAVGADELSDLQAQMQQLQSQMKLLQEQLQKVVAAKAQPQPAELAAASPKAVPPSNLTAVTGAETHTHHFFERKPGDSTTFYTLKGEITPYSNLDVSFDAATKGLGGKIGPDGFGPIGNLSWQPDISTNISYVGVRGFQTLSDLPFKFVYQFETQVDVASTAGVSETNSMASNVVKGALTTRNTFIGFSSAKWGAIKFGKTDPPYKLSTMRMNPFYGMFGDYQVIMSNTGGDNRVEFGTRLDHSIWYETPNWKGFAGVVLFSPGQNRALNSDNLAAGEADCTGGNIPGSGGITPITCSDGSFSDAVSASLTYTNGSLYIVSAYERHRKVNRQSDITALYASPNATEQLLESQDIADEDAGKIGVQYILPSKTTLSGIFETMHRYVPADLQFQNERQRMGSWLALSQQLSPKTSLNLGWARAYRTPGDPGQHNDSFATPPGGTPGVDTTGGANVDNSANLFSFALKYQAAKKLGFYASWAMTANGPAAHFDLGAGGRTVPIDCHDAFDASGSLVGSNPHCWTGGTLAGVSLGTVWKF